jgi:hypothetical protein
MVDVKHALGAPVRILSTAGGPQEHGAYAGKCNGLTSVILQSTGLVVEVEHYRVLPAPGRTLPQIIVDEAIIKGCLE